LPDRVPQEIAQHRYDRLMEIQQNIAFDWSNRRVGSTEQVLLDSPLTDQEGVWLGRTWAEAPEIDGIVYVSGFDRPDQISPGLMLPCEIVASDGYDLVAAPLD